MKKIFAIYKKYFYKKFVFFVYYRHHKHNWIRIPAHDVDDFPMLKCSSCDMEKIEW